MITLLRQALAHHVELNESLVGGDALADCGPMSRFSLPLPRSVTGYSPMRPRYRTWALSLFLLASGFSGVAAESSEAVTLFSIGETKGQYALLAEKGKPLDKPSFAEDKTSSGQFVQMLEGSDGKTKYSLVTNTGSSEVVMQIIGNAMVFFSISENMHSTLTICLDKKYPDGSYLVVETLVRPDAFGAGATLARIFYGKARPSPLIEAQLGATKK